MRANAPRRTVFGSGCRPRPAERSSGPGGPRGAAGSRSDRDTPRSGPSCADPIAAALSGVAPSVGSGSLGSGWRHVCPGQRASSSECGLRCRAPRGTGRRPQPPAATDTGRRGRTLERAGRRRLPGHRGSRSRRPVGRRAQSLGWRRPETSHDGIEDRRSEPLVNTGTTTTLQPTVTAPDRSGLPEQGQRPGPAARALMGAIRGYQLARAGRPSGCRFTPSCSSYGREAVERFGAVRGGVLALRRLMRCRPWGGAGFDPVPEERTP